MMRYKEETWSSCDYVWKILMILSKIYDLRYPRSYNVTRDFIYTLARVTPTKLELTMSIAETMMIKILIYNYIT